MAKKTESDLHIKKLAELQKKMTALKQEEKVIQDKIINHLSQALHYHDGFTVPGAVITGAIIQAIETYKNTPENTGGWQEAGEKFLKSRSRPAAKVEGRPPAEVRSPKAS